ncbi:MAG: 30S ribosomal protein S2 [Candidatus Pacebacteria bacterium]|jgi:small subunit ribosomal protein S2|nr:30S ribosomal protein S2 [Candidatus Paceibacterota bacterium]
MAETKQKDFKIDVEEMAQAGVHFGHKTSNIHPKMEPYLFGARSGIHIIDLDKTKEKLEEALKFISDIVSDGKTLLLVGTKVQIKDLVKKTAEECTLPYVSERWLGGTFTNFSSISKRIEHYKELERRKKEGELEKYTKKEKAKLDKELERLTVKFEGIRNLSGTPEAIFVCDMRKDQLALSEAKAKGVKIIALADTNVDPAQADYVIPANDDALSSVAYILGKVKEVVLKNKK